MSFWRISWQIYSHFLFPFQRITCVHRQINLCGVLSTIKILVWHRIVSHAWWRRLHKSLQKGINSQVRKEKARICISPFVKTHNTQIQACMSTVWLVYCSYKLSKEQCGGGGREDMVGKHVAMKINEDVDRIAFNKNKVVKL